MNNTVTDNYDKLKYSLFILPLLLLAAIAFYLYSQHSLSTEGYINIQKDWFYSMNGELSQFPETEFNLTQIGDSLISLSLLAVFVIYAPKIWEAVVSASLVSLLFSQLFKKLFSVPRPAAAFDNSTFEIIGKTLNEHSSLPSGHSITIFTMLTVLMFGFMPQKLLLKIFWFIPFIILGLVLVLTRVGVGAHYPLDTIIGGIIGYISGISGIFISRKYKIFSWIGNRKFYPIFMVLFLVCAIITIIKITENNLPVFYCSTFSLLVALFLITRKYVQK